MSSLFISVGSPVTYNGKRIIVNATLTYNKITGYNIDIGSDSGDVLKNIQGTSLPITVSFNRPGIGFNRPGIGVSSTYDGNGFSLSVNSMLYRKSNESDVLKFKKANGLEDHLVPSTSWSKIIWWMWLLVAVAIGAAGGMYWSRRK
jgi:hypothetical protein